ncbi:hypothetical protein L950_0224105 [Sphingobacterium sp. IITKGP-BTPF85]|nr:hypothetical protein L950_0224105 [Sphingobacterium sp. IITKGP-BTPF85]
MCIRHSGLQYHDSEYVKNQLYSKQEMGEVLTAIGPNNRDWICVRQYNDKAAL